MKNVPNCSTRTKNWMMDFSHCGELATEKNLVLLVAGTFAAMIKFS